MMSTQSTVATRSGGAILPSYHTPAIENPLQARDMLTRYGVRHADLDWDDARYVADHVIICWRSTSRPRSQHFIPLHPELDLDLRLKIVFLVRAFGPSWGQFKGRFTPIWYENYDVDQADPRWWKELEQWMHWNIEELPWTVDLGEIHLDWPRQKSVVARLLGPRTEYDKGVTGDKRDAPSLAHYGATQVGCSERRAKALALETLLYWPEITDPNSRNYIPFPEFMTHHARQRIACRLLRLRMTWPEFVARIGGQNGELPIPWGEVEGRLQAMTPMVISAEAMLFFLSGGLELD